MAQGPQTHNPGLQVRLDIREIEYVCTCVHFKDMIRLEWLTTLCTVCTRDAQLDYYTILLSRALNVLLAV
jgi:hypothetical protein